MTEKELMQYSDIKEEINKLKKQIKQVDSKYMRASLLNCESYEKSLSSPQEKRLILIEEYEIQLKKLLKRLKKIEKYIESIKDNETKKIFKYKFIDKKNFNKIAKLLNISKDSVKLKYRIEIDKLFKE